MRIDLSWNKSVIWAALLFAGCANDNLPSPQKLGPLRVLALSASKPEANPGDTVTITPIISDTTSGPRALSYSYQFCLDPGVAYGASPRCTGTLISSGSGTITAAEAPLTAAPYSGSANADTFNLSVPAGTLSGLDLNVAANGIPLLVTYDLTGGSETTRSFRRIIVTSRTGAALNAPLTLTGLQASGAAITSFPASEQDLTPVLGSSAETYTLISSTGEVLTRTEKLTVSWYVTDGEFEFSRTDGSSSNKWTPPSSGGTPLGLLLLRDDRGGVSNPVTVGY